jgi:hypothetical protein
MNAAEVLLVVVVVVLPVLLGAGAAMARRPWWWAALAAVILAFVGMVAPEPEPGESRLAAEDLGFVVVVLAVVVFFVWLGSLIGRRFAGNRPA